MKVLSIIEGEANILILLNDNNCEFDVAGLWIVLYSSSVLEHS